jgi:hypothetical protein
MRLGWESPYDGKELSGPARRYLGKAQDTGILVEAVVWQAEVRPRLGAATDGPGRAGRGGPGVGSAESMGSWDEPEGRTKAPSTGAWGSPERSYQSPSDGKSKRDFGSSHTTELRGRRTLVEP